MVDTSTTERMLPDPDVQCTPRPRRSARGNVAMRCIFLLAITVTSLGLAGCAQSAKRSPDPRIAELRRQQTALEAARADAVTVYGSESQTVRELDYHLQLIDQQIAIYESPSSPAPETETR